MAYADIFPVETGRCGRKYLLFNKTVNSVTDMNYDITTYSASQWQVILGGGTSDSRESLIG